MNSEAIYPLVATVTMFLLIFALYYLRNKENMALIERGINPRQNKAMPSPFASLKYGLLVLGCGVGLATAFFLEGIVETRKYIHGGGYVSYNDNSEALYFSLIAVGGGLGLVISYFVERKAWKAVEKNTNQ